MADFYFGNLTTGLVKRPAPLTGMDASTFGSSENMVFQNGGAYVSQSAGTHRKFEMSWGVQEKSVMNFLADYRNGVHGTGLLYMVDPFATNIMPPHWANPSLTCEGWPSLVGAAFKPVLSAGGTVTNLVSNPNLSVNTTGWQTGGPALVRSQFGGRWWVPAAANTYTYASATGAAGKFYSTSIRVRGPVGTSVVTASTDNIVGSVTNQVAGVIPASGELVLNSTSNRAVSGGALAFGLSLGAGATGVFVTEAYLEEVPGVGVAPGVYFDGSTVFVNGTAGKWNGAANASTSSISRTYGNLPNMGAQYTLTGAIGAVPTRKLTLLIPEDRDLHFGFSGVSSGVSLRMQPITRDGAFGPVSNITLLSPTASTRLNTKVSGAQYRAVQIYMTPTVAGGGTINLVSSKAIYAYPSESPVLTGGHSEGEGHTGLQFSDAPTMTYIQAVNGKQKVSTAANFTEIEAWL